MSTLPVDFVGDLAAYAAAGADGIGIWESKLPAGGDAEALEALAASGLEPAAAVPLVPSILPLPLLGGPDDPQARVAALVASIHRLAAFRPSGIVCLTGSAGTLAADTARSIVVAGLREIGAEAERVGVRIGLEPYQREGIEPWSIANTIGDAVELIEEAGSPGLGIQFDSWHLWNTPDVVDDIEREAHRFVGVHIADYREPTRSWADRVLPGDGVADLPAILGALDRAGWDGLYDLEIFSDNGAFGTAHPDSLWDVDAAELVRRGRERFITCWQERRVAVSAGPGEERA
ncbi:MAG: sugar phosphate isomerase/epimerase family protein [Gaiellaceae bacterium]